MAVSRQVLTQRTGIVDDQELATYKLRYEEFCTPKPFYCPTRTCSRFISPRVVKAAHAQGDRPVTCPDCHILICIKCRQTAEPAHECPPNDPLVTTVRNFKYKICPKCGTGVLKLYGCDHVRCRCGAHWCWACERSIDRCNLDPCPLSLDFGAGGADDTEDDTDDDETIAVESTNSVPIGQNSDASVEHETQPERDEAYVAQNAERNQPAADTVAGTNSSTIPPVPTQASNTSLPENLDDPDEHLWECEDLELGDEPVDEAWDIWGCAHRFRRFDQENMLEKWVKPEALECQTCFELVRPYNDISATKSLKKARSETEEQDLAAQTGNSEVPQETSNVPVMARRRSGKLAWECKKCGVFFCQECRASIKSRHKSKTDGGQSVFDQSHGYTGPYVF